MCFGHVGGYIIILIIFVSPRYLEGFEGYFDGFMRILVNFGGVGLVYSEFSKNWFTKVKTIKQFTIEGVILLSK